MLRPIREDCGLGSPPDPFYTNASESMNNVIKVKVDYKRNELPQFMDKLHALCEEQQHEVEKAIIGCGKYTLRPQYQYLEVDESKCFLMMIEQRKQHLKMVAKAAVSAVNDPDSLAYSTSAGTSSNTECH